MNRARLLGPMIGSFALALGCAGVKQDSTSGAAGAGNATGLGGFGGGSPPPMPCQGMCIDFPPTPRTDGNVPANAADIFGTPGSGTAGGPCVIEPQENVVPQQLAAPAPSSRPAPASCEIRLHASIVNDLVVTPATRLTCAGYLDRAGGPRATSDYGHGAQRRPAADRCWAARFTSRSRPSEPTGRSSTGRRRGRRTSTASRPAPRPC